MIYFLKSKIIFLLVTLLILSEGVLVAGTTVTAAQFDADINKLDLSPHIEILIDPDHSLSIDNITDPEKQYAFQPVSEIGNSFGFSKSAYWVRFSLNVDDSSSDALLLELEYPLLDNVTLFVPDGEGEFSVRKTGDTLPFAMRDIQYRNYLFKLPQHAGEHRDYYMRLESQGSIQIPLSLWTSSTFIEHIDTVNFIFGGYYGTMMLLMLAALVAFIKIRDRLFIYYAIYLLSYLLFQLSLNGLSYQYLWPELPWFTSRVTTVLVSFVVLGGLLFSGSFLQIWNRRHFYIKVFFVILMSSAVISMLISIFGSYAFAVQMSTITGLLLPPAVLIAAIRSLMLGYKPALYFLAAWGVFLFGVFVAGLLYLGLLPSTFLTTYAMQIGSTFEVILLGYAMFDRISLLHDEKEKAIVKANAYLHQINEGLESLVDKRTEELQEKNNQLRELAIRDSMTGMLNHNSSIEHLDQMKSAAIRYNNTLTTVMLDIDWFKKINDNYGHPAGDRVIIAIADVLNENIRASDVCGRYGGEEFILILPELDGPHALELCERIRKNIMTLKIPEIDNTLITASFGVSTFDPSHPDTDLIMQADIALYNAKAAGRNRIVLSEQ
ncbi:MAG: diguanylate cyclase [Campylobacterota bacterium]|nr:diguanylate cyclase [Campylobacterota bacterium]